MANNSNNWKNSSNNENVPAALKNINMPGMSQSKHNDVSGLHQPSTGLSSDDGLDNTPSIEEGQNNNMMPGGNLNNPLNGDMPGNEEAKSKLGKNNNFLPNSFGNQQQNMPEEDDSTKSGSQMFMDGAKKLANTAMGIGGMGGSQNNEDLPASVKITQKAKKWIKIMQFIAPVLPYIGIIFIVMIVAYMIIIQLAILKEKITLTLNNGVIAVTTFHEKYLNFFSGKGWRTEEDVFFKELIYRYEQGKSISPSMGGPIELDVPLLLSTINYSKVIDPSIHEVGGQDKVTDCPENNPDCDTEKDDSAIESSQTFWEGYLQVKQIRNFYYVANDKLGSIFTLVPGQRRLLGHMVTWKVGISTGTMSEAVQGWVDLLRLLGFITSDTVSDIWDIIFIFDEFEKMKAYAAQGKNHDSYTEYGERNYFYEVEEIISMCGEVVKEFYDFISGKSKDASEEEKSLWSTIPYPKVTIKLDNEYRPRSDGDYGYAEYLRRVYVPGNFFSDPKGEKYSQEALDIIVRDIFAQKRQYDEFMEGFGSTDGSSTGGGTNCEYDLTPKVNIGGNLSSYGDEYKSVSNIKVRLMECNTSGRPSATEELIDFEYYIMGVSYAEIGPDAPVEAIKAQAVAARSYSLIRGAAMNQPSFSNIKKLMKVGLFQLEIVHKIKFTVTQIEVVIQITQLAH